MTEISVEQARKKVMDSILLRLGGDMLDVELTEAHLNKCVDLAIAKLRQRSDAAIEESLVLLTLKKNQKEYYLPEEVVDVQQIYRRGYGRAYGSTGGQNMDPFQQAWTNVYMAGAVNGTRTGGLVTYEMHNNYMKTAGKMFGAYMNFTFNPNSHRLVISENPRADDEVILLHSYTYQPEQYLIIDRFSGLWVENWSLAEAKEMLGTIRGRFSGLPGPNGGIQQDDQQLKAEAKEMKEGLMKELDNFITGGDYPMLPFSG